MEPVERLMLEAGHWVADVEGLAERELIDLPGLPSGALVPAGAGARRAEMLALCVVQMLLARVDWETVRGWLARALPALLAGVGGLVALADYLTP
jgi:hypothetical protein